MLPSFLRKLLCRNGNITTIKRDTGTASRQRNLIRCHYLNLFGRGGDIHILLCRRFQFSCMRRKGDIFFRIGHTKLTIGYYIE